MEEKRVKDVRQICIDIFGTDKDEYYGVKVHPFR